MKIGFLLLLLVYSTVTLANDGCVTQIQLAKHCDNLDMSNTITDNPYYYKNPNTLCGLNFNLPGLPDLSFLNGHMDISGLSFCKLLRGAVTGNILDKLKNALPHFADAPPPLG